MALCFILKAFVMIKNPVIIEFTSAKHMPKCI